MFTNFRKTVMVATTLFVSFTVLSAENSNLAPRSSAAEAEMSFWDMPLLEDAFINAAPEKLKGGLEVGQLGINGGDQSSVLQVAEALSKNEYGKYDSLLISHKGKLLFESYYNRGRIDLPHFQSSATKGYTSLMLGRAVQLGYITMEDLHKPLVSFFKGLDRNKLATGTEQVTLHHVLSMRSGLRFSDEQLKEFRENRDKYSGIAEVQAFLELSQPVTKASQVFKYQASDPLLVMHVIDAMVPGSTKDFVEKEFFNKLGITNYKWPLDPKGLPIGDSGVNLTSRDMVKIGEMLANQGKWQNKQLLSEDYLGAAFEAVTKATESWHPDNFYYGYLWYQTSIVLNQKSYGVNLTWGAGGNRIIVVEELELVIVVTGHDREDVVFEPIAQYIIPAFVKSD